MACDLPQAVREKVSQSGEVIEVVSVDPIESGTGAASGSVTRIGLRVRSTSGEMCAMTLVRKQLRLLVSGRHADGATDLRHWAYWRREANAYESGLVPTGPGLRAPGCLGVVGDEVWLEDVCGPRPSVEKAARALARWQATGGDEPDRPWLCAGQLGQRLAVTDLDWSTVDADERIVDLWRDRTEIYQRFSDLPVVLSHGDYSLGNLVDGGHDVVALDWATVGWEPVGFDVGHLALGSGKDASAAYLEQATFDRDAVEAGYKATIVLVGASRLHWMLTRGIQVPAWYAEFILTNRPDY